MCYLCQHDSDHHVFAATARQLRPLGVPLSVTTQCWMPLWCLLHLSVTTQCWMPLWCHNFRLILILLKAAICNRIPIMGLVSLSHYRPWSEQSNQCRGSERTWNPVQSSSEGCHLLADVFYANYVSKENLLRSFVTASALVCVGRGCFAWLR